MKRFICCFVLAFNSLMPLNAQDHLANLKQVILLDDVDLKSKVRTIQQISAYYKANADHEGLVDYLQLVAKNGENTELEAVAFSVMVPVLVKLGRFNEAISICQWVKSEYKGTKWGEECLWGLGEIYTNAIADDEKLAEVYNEMKRDYPACRYFEAIGNNIR